MGETISLIAVAGAAFFAGYQRAAYLYTRKYSDRLLRLIETTDRHVREMAETLQIRARRIK
jgi:hypothetical protein